MHNVQDLWMYLCLLFVICCLSVASGRLPPYVDVDMSTSITTKYASDGYYDISAYGHIVQCKDILKAAHDLVSPTPVIVNTTATQVCPNQTYSWSTIYISKILYPEVCNFTIQFKLRIPVIYQMRTYLVLDGFNWGVASLFILGDPINGLRAEMPSDFTSSTQNGICNNSSYTPLQCCDSLLYNTTKNA